MGQPRLSRDVASGGGREERVVLGRMRVVLRLGRIRLLVLLLLGSDVIEGGAVPGGAVPAGAVPLGRVVLNVG